MAEAIITAAGSILVAVITVIAVVLSNLTEEDKQLNTKAE